MNILFITQLFPEKKEGCYTSGALREFIEEWGKAGHKISVIRPHYKYEKDPFPNEPKFKIGENIDVEFIKPLRIPVLKMGFYSSKKILKKLNFKPDVVICHLYNSYFTFPALAKKLNIPMIAGIHMSDTKLAKHTFHRWHQNLVFKNVSGFACRSEAYKRKFDTLFPNHKNKSFLAMSGIPDYFFANNPKRKSAQTPVKILTVSSLIKRKQIEHVIDALSKIKTISWHFNIVGTGPELENLVNLVAQHSMEKNVTFKGNLPRKLLVEEFMTHDVFILPSYEETFGLVYLEAMASGNITIGSINEGIDGIIVDGENGYLCDPYNKLDILQKLNLALNLDDEERNRIIQSAKATSQHFTLTEMAVEYLTKITQLISDDNYTA